ncbi:paeninodin family lasso peptide [Litchfieldia salsa]|uniref:Paeninodin family lasso peptide n=1 Tax=Litchfieldia salsa TaxID=930152 RepID=A0A1H0VEU7_9BACI|nr:hypothetical protein SAMN05216565_106247 [Litchfieldia salsa]
MKEWKVPVLEVLDISMTMLGPGKEVPDCYEVGEANGNQHGQGQDPGLSNTACKALSDVDS